MKKYAGGLAALLAVASMQAMAVLPASVGTSFTAMQGDIEDVFDIVIPVVLSVATLVLVVKYIKRGAAKL